ncbi:MAG: hypothetical protein GX575_15930 [Candidatus Anammoximicrobium sp.]|nr:hypothetical protein [Candidatus Anammoximicrobium sp.]
MMGNKTLAQIRDELTEELDRAGLEPAAWFEEQLGRLQTNVEPDPADLETLRLIRDALASFREPIHAGGG